MTPDLPWYLMVPVAAGIWAIASVIVVVCGKFIYAMFNGEAW